MAGGEGTRLRPLTSNAPKPMLPVVNRPMMEHIVDLLRSHGFDDIVVTLAFMADTISNHFGDGSEFGVRMQYAIEETPLGTAGSVRNAAAHLDERFLVISGDVLTDIDLAAIVAFHEERGALATIGLTPVQNPLEFGIVITREDGSIERFLEKPTWGEVFSDTINTGIFVLEPQIFDWIDPDRPVDFSSEVFPRLLEAGEPIFGAVAEGYWEDVGTLEAYLRAHKDVLDSKVALHVPGFAVREHVWMGEGAEIHPEAVVDGPAVIGDNCRLEAGARLGEYVVLGANVRVREDAQLERSIVYDNSYLGEGVRLRGTVVGRSCDLRNGARSEEGAVIGDECFVGEDALIGVSVKVYPFKTVEAGATINSSLVWESKGARTLFSGEGVVGLANVDVTPEYATKLAMAYASMLKKGTIVVSSRDSSRSARMLKRAMMAGLNAGGITVEDLEVAPIPVTRFSVRRTNVGGGFTVRLLDDDPQSVVIRFFDADGLDITEDTQRKLERIFGREDFRRAFPGEIGEIGYPPRALEHYATAIEATVDIAAISAAGFKIVVDYAYGSTAVVMPNVLAKLGAEVLAVNPFVSTTGLLESSIEHHVDRVAGLVRASGAQLGTVLAPGGEQLLLVDDRGEPVGHTEATLAMLTLLPGKLDGDRVALPVNATKVAAELLEAHGIGVQATKLSSAALMEVATEPGVGFAANFEGGFVLPGFLPGFDAAAMLVKVLDLLAARGLRLSEVVDGLPRVHLSHATVITPSEQKGLVMRSLVEQTKDRDVEMVDGVKVFHGEGWVLCRPDPGEPLTHIWAEGTSDSDARRLSDEYTRRIRQLMR